MSVSFNGINESIVTFNTEGDLNPGCLVSISKDNTVKKASADSNFIGVCISSKSNIAAIQISGFLKIKMKSLGDISYGRQYFTSDDDASLKLSDFTEPSSVPLNVVAIDKVNSTVDVFL